jgi:two-component system chemotaxis response regulator CheY
MAGRRVLLIDDDALIRRQVCDALNEAHPGLEISEAGDGAAALEKLTTFEADLVLLDLFMPELSGVETLEFIRRRPNPPKVLIMSSLDSDGMKQQLLDLGAEGFIGKPFHPVELADAVFKHLQ